MPTTPLPPAQPTDLPSLHAWLLSHQPFTGPNTPHPDPNDFTTLELHQFLTSAISHFQQAKSSLAEALHSAKDEQICDTLITATSTLNFFTNFPVPVMEEFEEIVFSAKFADDLRLRNLLVGLKGAIRRMRKEMGRVERLLEERETAQREAGKEKIEVSGDGKEGDEDDWFVIGAEERGQVMLFEAIEEHLRRERNKVV